MLLINERGNADGPGLRGSASIFPQASLEPIFGKIEMLKTVLNYLILLVISHGFEPRIPCQYYSSYCYPYPYYRPYAWYRW